MSKIVKKNTQCKHIYRVGVNGYIAGGQCNEKRMSGKALCSNHFANRRALYKNRKEPEIDDTNEKSSSSSSSSSSNNNQDGNQKEIATLKRSISLISTQQQRSEEALTELIERKTTRILESVGERVDELSNQISMNSQNGLNPVKRQRIMSALSELVMENIQDLDEKPRRLVSALASVISDLAKDN